MMGSAPQSPAAFFQWRLAVYKRKHTRQLQEILQEVSVQESAAGQLEQQLQRAHSREKDLLQKLSQLKGELTATAELLIEQQAHAADLQSVIDSYDAQVLAPLAKRLTAAEEAHAEQLQQHKHREELQQHAVHQLKQEQLQLLQEHQQLLDVLADKEQQAAQLSSEASLAQERATAAQHKLEAMQGVLRSTAEQAAAAEGMSSRSSEAVIALQQQLSELNSRRQAELLELQGLRATAASTAGLQERLQDSTATAAAMSASCQELQGALDDALARLAASSERCRQLEGRDSAAQQLCNMVANGPAAGDGFVAALAQHLDTTQTQLSQLAPRLAAAELTVQQQQLHIQRLNMKLQQQQQQPQAAAVPAGGQPQEQPQLALGSAVADGALASGSTTSGVGELVPMQLLAAARSSLDAAAAQAAALQQQLEHQASAQQVAAAAYVDRVDRKQSEMVLRCTWLLWRLAVGGEKAQQLQLECEAVRIQLERQQQASTASHKRLSAFLKHRSRSHKAAAQQQHIAAVTHAWQRQVVRQVGATWAWRQLAQQLLQQRRADACEPTWLSNMQQQQEEMSLQDSGAAALNGECSWEGIRAEGSAENMLDGPNPADTSCNTGVTQPGAAAPAGVGGALVSDGTDGGRVHGQQGGSFMHRLMQRRRDPVGNSCRAAAAAGRLLAAAWRAWHMTAALARRAKEVQQAEQQLEAVSSGLSAWVAMLGDRRRLERAWLGWRLAALKTTACQQQPQQQQQSQTQALGPQQQRRLQQSGAAARRQEDGVQAVRQQRQGPAWQQQPQQQQQQQHLPDALSMFAGMPRWQIKVAAAASAGGMQQPDRLDQVTASPPAPTPVEEAAAATAGSSAACVPQELAAAGWLPEGAQEAEQQQQQQLLQPQVAWDAQAFAVLASPQGAAAGAQAAGGAAWQGVPSLVAGTAPATDGAPAKAVWAVQQQEQQQPDPTGVQQPSQQRDSAAVGEAELQAAISAGPPAPVAAPNPTQQQQQQQVEQAAQMQQVQLQQQGQQGTAAAATTAAPAARVPGQAPVVQGRASSHQQPAVQDSNADARVKVTKVPSGSTSAHGKAAATTVKTQQGGGTQQAIKGAGSKQGLGPTQVQRQTKSVSLRGNRRAPSSSGGSKPPAGGQGKAAAEATSAAAEAGVAAAHTSRVVSAAVPKASVPQRANSSPSPDTRGLPQGPAQTRTGAAAAAARGGELDSVAKEEVVLNREGLEAAAASSRVRGRLAGIASSLSALQQQVQQHTTAIAPAGSVQVRAASPARHTLNPAALLQPQQQHQSQQWLGVTGGMSALQGVLYPLPQQQQGPQRPQSPPWQPVGVAAASERARSPQPHGDRNQPSGVLGTRSRGLQARAEGSSPDRGRAGSAVGVSGGASGRLSGSSSPVKLAAGVQAQLAGYQERLLHLQSTLHHAARPWSRREQQEDSHTTSSIAVDAAGDGSISRLLAASSIARLGGGWPGGGGGAVIAAGMPAVEGHRPVVVRPQSPEVVWDAEPPVSSSAPAAAAGMQTLQPVRQAHTGMFGASAAGQQMLQVQGGLGTSAGLQMLQAQAQGGPVEWCEMSPAQAEWHMVGQPRVCGLVASPRVAAGAVIAAMEGTGAASVGAVSSTVQGLRLNSPMAVAGGWGKVLAAQQGSWQGGSAGLIPAPHPQHQQTAPRRITTPATIGADDDDAGTAEAARETLMALTAAAGGPAAHGAAGSQGASTDGRVVQEPGVVRFERLC